MYTPPIFFFGLRFKMAPIQKLARYLVSLELWVVGIAVFLSMAVNGLLPWVVALMAVYWVVRRVAWGKGLPRGTGSGLPRGTGRGMVATRVDFPVAFLVLLIPLNAWISPLPEKSLPQLLRLLSGIGLFYAIVNALVSEHSVLPVRKRLDGMVWSALIVAVGMGVFSLFSVQWANDKLPFMPEKIYSFASILVADTVHPNVMAGTLVIFLPILLGIMMFAGGEMPKWQRLVFVFSILSVIAVLVLTQSRGALISFGVALLGLILLRWRWAYPEVRGGGWIGAGAGIVLIAGTIWRTGWDRVLDTVLVSATLGGVNGREQIWQRALYIIQDFPLTGVGMGLFGDVADALYPFAGVEPGRISHAHQLFLQVAVDLGLPGFAAWLTILGLVFLSAWQMYRGARGKNNRWMAGLGAGLLGSQTALCVHGLLDAVTWGMVRPAPLVWGIWGLTMAAWMLREQG